MISRWTARRSTGSICRAYWGSTELIRILRAADHKSMPWKNGGGVTTEIVVHPEGSALDAFDWRVSMAQVASDGPFSAFPGIDRTLAVLEGAGISLTIGGEEPVLLGKESAPLTFPADQPTHGALATGPILDLNVMVRRGSVRASVERHVVSGTLDLSPEPGWTLVLVNHGSALLRHDGSVENLDARDCLLVEDGGPPLRIEASEACECYIIRLARDA